MSEPIKKNLLRSIPSVDGLLGSAEIERLRTEHPHFPWTRLARTVIDDFRGGKYGVVAADRAQVTRLIERKLLEAFEELRSGGVRRVINATGVILHTNLGRAVLGPDVQEAVHEAMAHYMSLEFDIDTATRTARATGLNDLIALATGAEAAMVVNNNAAAVHIVIDSYSPPGRVIVSRGELVEIGGSFRLPDILSKAADEVMEVGTTNRTYVDDYTKVAQPGDLLLKVHRSNYDIQGFTHEAEIAELVALGRERDCHVVFDLGSGSLFDFAAAGIEGEDVVARVLESGVDCVTMSGDKLLGGVQAGVIVGSEIFLAKVRSNPIRRALRVDKVTVAALQALLRTYLFDAHPESKIPVLQQATETVEALRDRAQQIVDGLSTGARSGFNVTVVDDIAAIGGGSFACQDVLSAAVAITCASDQAAEALARRMRRQKTPIISRIKGNEVRLNLRTVMPYEDADLIAELESALADETNQ